MIPGYLLPKEEHVAFFTSEGKTDNPNLYLVRELELKPKQKA